MPRRRETPCDLGQRVADLRAGGFAWKEIAWRCGFSRSTVIKAFLAHQAALKMIYKQITGLPSAGHIEKPSEVKPLLG